MPRLLSARPAAVALLAGGVLVAIFAALLLHYRRELTQEIHQKIVERDAAVLQPVAVLQLGEVEARDFPDSTPTPNDTVLAVLKSAQQTGMLGVAVFDADGNPLQAVPASMAFADLAPVDYLELTRLKPISRYHADFDLASIFAGSPPVGEPSPVLEVLLPLHRAGGKQLAGVAQYFIDARPLARELALIDHRISVQTFVTLGIGGTLVFLVVGAAYWGLLRAQRIIAERNERLIRANFELSLAAKASVLGQITSHLLHGLQGPVAGLRAVLATRGTPDSAEDWQTASDYTERLQAMIRETVTMLGERSSETAYELSGHDLAAALRERHQPAARTAGVMLVVEGGFAPCVDSNRGNLLCLIAGNLIENALQASPAGTEVRVNLELVAHQARVTVADQGPGIPDRVLEHLFEPGRTGRAGGTGLGLAISHLLARQIGAKLTLLRTSNEGTSFRVSLDGVGDQPSRG
jgi:signal transduction histidine kinase